MLTEELATIRSRGQVKTLGRVLDNDPAIREVAERLAEARGIGAVVDMDGKRLVKALLDRSASAQVRVNPIRRDESFLCVKCGGQVDRGGAQVRDHCPLCLTGLHVDDVPGDRAADCGGMLVPYDFTVEGRAGVIISYRCERCGYQFRVRSHPDDKLPKGLRLGHE